jgi:hypothetical protein
MGAEFSTKDIPGLENALVHMCSPLVHTMPLCVIGRVKYVEVGDQPKILYITPSGSGYSVRVDVDSYTIHETLGDD